jgi:hypothetical protein
MLTDERSRIDRFLLAICHPQTSELVADLWRHPNRWRVNPDGEVTRNAPYPAGYCPKSRYLSWAITWGYGYRVTFLGHIAFTRAIRALSAKDTQP